MYLVTINKFENEVNDGIEIQHTFSIEQLQAIDYQLKSSTWSVLDCVPSKGGTFEVHFGGDDSNVRNSFGGIEYRIMAVYLCPCSASAIDAATNMVEFFDDGCESTFCLDMITGTCLYLEGIVPPDKPTAQP